MFGYSDAPIVRNAQSFAAVVPTALIQANPSVQVTALFAPAAYRAARIIEGVTSAVAPSGSSCWRNPEAIPSFCSMAVVSAARRFSFPAVRR